MTDKNQETYTDIQANEKSVIRDKDTRFKALKGVIWDLDNTLYRAHEELHQAYHIAAARIAVRDGLEPDLDTAMAKAKKSYEETEFSGRFLISEHGYDGPRLHFELHELIDETAIIKTQNVARLFREAGLKNALITHGSQGWARRVLAHLELTEFFAPEATLSLETFDFQRKNSSDRALNMALYALDLMPADVIVVEDIIDNLRIPHENGVFTVFVHHGQKRDDLPDFVDAQYDNAITLLNDVMAVRDL